MSSYRDQLEEVSGSLVRAKGAFGSRPKDSIIKEVSKSQIVSVFHEIPSEDKVVFESRQDVSPILKANTREYNSGHDGYSPSREMRKVASIPLIEVERLLSQGINIFDEADWPKIASKLDDPDWLKFRTSPEKLSRKPRREFFKASSGR